MSLFLGNLSAHIRVDDILRVFMKFGPCFFNRKGLYGFVEYDSRQDAEKAFRVLQGRRICGEPLVLSWSKKQHLPFEGHQRVFRSYKLQGRHPVRGREFADRRTSLNDRRGYISGINQPDADGVKANSVNMLNDCIDDPQTHVKNDKIEHRHMSGGLSVDGLTDVAEPVDAANSTEHDLKFDRYEPCQSNEGEDEHQNLQMGYSGCGSVPQRPQENARILNSLNVHNALKSQVACFGCGNVGHMIRDCPRKYSSGRKPSGFDHRHDDANGKTSKGEAGLDRFRPITQENLHLSKDTNSRHRRSERASVLERSQMLRNNKTSRVNVGKESDRTEMKDSGRKKRGRWDCKSPIRSSGKKARMISSQSHSAHPASRSPKRKSAKKARTVSSQPHSDRPVSKSCSASQSSKSVSRCSTSPARSKSVSMRRRSLSSDSRSSSKSMSRSSSFTTSSDSLSQSSYKARVNLKCPKYNNTKAPKSKEIPFGKRQPIDKDALLVHNAGSELARCSAPEFSKQKIDVEDSVGLMDREAEVKEPASEMHIDDCSWCSTCISSEEMCMVLKHNGMELPEESDRHLPVEEYFGSARLWPWEIIYYRRLKKGLISVENYARRVSQNQEFDIVDKYVRSSSGWGEGNS